MVCILLQNSEAAYHDRKLLNGIPVICSDLGNMGYTIIEGENGAKFDPLSTDSIVDATNRFSTYDYEKLRKNSLITFKENFSKEKNMELFGKIYESGKV